MKTPSSLAFAVVFAVGAAFAQEKPPAAEPRFIGEWTVVKVVRGGEPRAGGDSVPARMHFHKDGGYRLTYLDTMVTAQGVLEKSHDLVGKMRVHGPDLDLLDEDGKAVLQSGVFKFEQGELTIALGPGAARPKSFDESGSAEVLTLRPAKK